MTSAERALVSMTIDLIWAMEWIDSLTDNLNTARDGEHPRTREFLDDLAQRRIGNHTLDACAKEANL